MGDGPCSMQMDGTPALRQSQKTLSAAEPDVHTTARRMNIQPGVPTALVRVCSSQFSPKASSSDSGSYLIRKEAVNLLSCLPGCLSPGLARRPLRYP
jgi:hypothetical protein